MAWKPSTRQIEIVDQYLHARMSPARIAAALGIAEAEFTSWAGRLIATREVPPIEVPMIFPAPREREARITADRDFEGA